MAVNDRLLVGQVTVDVDILPTPLPEDRLVLERELEALFGPVIHIVGEVDFASDDDVEVLQEREVESRVDPVVLIQDHSSAMVALLESLENPMGIVRIVLAARFHVAVPSLVSLWRMGHGPAGVIRRSLEMRSLGDIMAVCGNDRGQ